jgi:predicted AlkP superfamily phosphohydrolase/phosphomutase
MGTQVARSVQRRDAVYDGPYVDQAPHIVFDQTPGIHTSGAIGANPVFDDVSQWAAENVRTGLFLADGPRVNGEAPTEISLTDIAPKILQSVGSPIPVDMDRTPLELFDGDTPTH